MIGGYLTHQCVVLAEKFADGQADEFQLMKARQVATYRGVSPGLPSDAGYRAYQSMKACAALVMSQTEVDEAILLAGNAAVTSRWSWFDEQEHQCDLLRDVFNPFHTTAVQSGWQTAMVTSVAQASYDQRDSETGHLDPTRLAVLSDALEEAGCTDDTLLSHLRSPGPHVRGCWALDLVLGKQ